MERAIRTEKSVALLPGDHINQYIVEARIGKGGMAVVYRVKHNQLESTHALKVVTLTSPDLRMRLLQEGQIQAQLKHPNAVTVTDVVEVDGLPGLVMEYVDGPELETWVSEQEPELEEKLRVFRGIVEGVRAAHLQGMVHRDLKPTNVLMQRTADGWRPKVADFGLAKALDLDRSLTDTRSGMPMGTPSYMAPEQIYDARDVDTRADVFALGALLYWLVTGARAFQGNNVLEIFTAVHASDYVPARERVDALPDEVVLAIDGCLVPDRTARIGSCDELLNVLDGAEWTPPPPPPSPTRPWAIAAMMGLLVFAIVGALAVGRELSRPLAGTEPPAAPEPEAVEIDLAEPPQSLQEPGAAPPARRARPVRPTRPEPPPTEPQPEPAGPCGGSAGEVVGYINTARRSGKRTGETWVLEEREPVLKTHSADGEHVCTLPAGTSIEITVPVVKVRGSGIWVPVVADAAHLP